MKAAFRAAPARGATGYELTGGELRSDAGWAVPLAEVEAVGFVAHTGGGLRRMRLDLVRQGRRHGVEMAMSADADPGASADYRAFLLLAGAALRQIATVRPGLEVTLGEGGRARLVMFAIGLISAIGALGLFGLALATGISSDRLMKAGGGLAVLLLLGLAIAWGARPGQARPRLAPGVLADRFDRWLGELGKA